MNRSSKYLNLSAIAKANCLSHSHKCLLHDFTKMQNVTTAIIQISTMNCTMGCTKKCTLNSFKTNLDQDNLVVELEDPFDIPNQHFQHCNRRHRPFERTFDNRDTVCRPGI